MLKYSAYYLTFLCVFGSFIQYIFNCVPYIELIDYIPIIFVIYLLIQQRIAKRRMLFYRMPLAFWVWIFFLVVHMLYSIILTGSIRVPIIGLYTYMVFFIYWYEYISTYNMEFSIEKYFKFCMILVGIIGLLGIYQYFFDISVFGYASSLSDRYNINLYYNYSVIRIISIFPSIQVLSCFIVLSLALLFENVKMITRTYAVILSFVLIVTGILTGSKIILFSIIVLIFYSFALKQRSKFSKKRTANLIITISILTILIIIIFPYINQVNNATVLRMAQPILNFNEFLSSELQSDTRIDTYMSTLTQNSAWILGNGIGTSNSTAINDRIALESYILQMLIEVGVIGLIIFIWLVLSAYKCRNLRIKHRGMIIVMLFTMFFNQAFTSVVFFPFYCFILYPMLFDTKAKV